MDASELEKLRYPIGRFEAPAAYDPASRRSWIQLIGALPSWLDTVIENLDAAQLETPYRPDGWTMVQVIHHLADSHMNAFIRLKLALTEDLPTVKPYDEGRWAATEEIEAIPVNVSITLLHALHRRWTALLQHMPDAAWERSFLHPELGREIPVWESTAQYAWHGRHHMEQLRALRRRLGVDSD